jgi:glycosyltransferase involved in cell wall biosynthesis
MYRKAVLVVLAKALGRRVVLHIHSGPGDVASFRAGMSGRRAGLLRSSLRRSDVVLAVSEASRVELEKAFGLTEIALIPNAAPPVAPEPAVVRRREGQVVFLGGFANPVKGGAEMLDALSLIEPGELNFVLAGPGDLPQAGQQLVNSRSDLEWLGWVDGKKREEMLDSASIFVLASVSEGLPMALLEAMSRGQAIAATEVGGVPDVLDDEVEGLLVPPADPGALAQAIARLGEDPALRERLGRAAHGRAAEMGADRVAERLAEIYEELLKD